MNADERRYNLVELIVKSTTEAHSSLSKAMIFSGVFSGVFSVCVTLVWNFTINPLRDSEDAGGIWNISTWM